MKPKTLSRRQEMNHRDEGMIAVPGGRVWYRIEAAARLRDLLDQLRTQRRPGLR